MERVFILAENARMADNWCRERGLNPRRDAVYVHSWENIIGARDFKYVELGCWHCGKSHEEIDIIEARIKGSYGGTKYTQQGGK